MSPVHTLRPKLPSGGVSIFAVMTRLANEVGAINLSQGFPDFDTSPELIDSVARYMREGFNQYAPMPGVPALREARIPRLDHRCGVAGLPRAAAVGAAAIDPRDHHQRQLHGLEVQGPDQPGPGAAQRRDRVHEANLVDQPAVGV
jgi:hypothetical protein